MANIEVVVGAVVVGIEVVVVVEGVYVGIEIWIGIGIVVTGVVVVGITVTVVVEVVLKDGPGRSRSMTRVLDLLKFLWALPGSIVGVLLAAALGDSEKTESYHGTWVIRAKRLIPASAIAQTWGQVILSKRWPPSLAIIAHEGAHVRQWRLWGPLFFVAYPLASLWALVRGRRPYRDNWFEVQAYAVETSLKKSLEAKALKE